MENMTRRMALILATLNDHKLIGQRCRCGVDLRPLADTVRTPLTAGTPNIAAGHRLHLAEVIDEAIPD